jgi:DNA-binding IclR family transcriptional regulator
MMPSFVPATSRTMAIFETFASQQRELSNSEMSRFLGIPESSCSDLMHTLLETGYLTRTVTSKRFYPTAKLLATAKSMAANDPLRAVSADAADLLQERTGETALCGRLEPGRVAIAAAREATHPLRYVVPIGDKAALHVSAMGKALLAAIPPEEASKQLRKRPLRQVTPRTITDPAVLEAHIAEVRERGWAEVVDEGVLGVTAYASAGIVGGEPLALCIAGPSERMAGLRDTYLGILLDVKKLVLGSEDE